MPPFADVCLNAPQQNITISVTCPAYHSIDSAAWRACTDDLKSMTTRFLLHFACILHRAIRAADAYCRLNDAQQSAFQDITNISNERRQLVDELEGLRSQFKAYQRVKAREVSALDHRVRILLHSQAVAGTMPTDDVPTSAQDKARYHAVLCTSRPSTGKGVSWHALMSLRTDLPVRAVQTPCQQHRGRAHC